MTPERYRDRVLSMERFVGRSFFCCSWDPEKKSWTCGKAPWWPHAEAAISYLQEVIDADFYGVERPPAPTTGIAHLDADIEKMLTTLEKRWLEE